MLSTHNEEEEDTMIEKTNVRSDDKDYEEEGNESNTSTNEEEEIENATNKNWKASTNNDNPHKLKRNHIEMGSEELERARALVNQAKKRRKKISKKNKTQKR
mmetsp:Transcript_4355/g.6109  ORF Transcript_4355/g.6109 Transcript_4355/m.6109 type:complete len:102 (+) Transcript_4355:285-590(+)